MTSPLPGSIHRASLVAEVIAIGSEMLFSNRVDTHSVYIAGRLDGYGVPLIARSIVGDDSRVIKQALGLALTRSDFIFLTGGLGPTEDDVTRHAVSELLSLELKYHSEIVEQIKDRFRRLGRTMNEINKRQGFILETATALENTEGTAPGQYLKYEGRHIFLLPGPPQEMQPMIQRHLIPLLDQLGLRPASRKYFRIAELPESHVETLVAPIYRQYPEIHATILAAPGDIELFFRAEDDSSRLSELADRITQVLGDSVYATEEITLEVVLAHLLKERRSTLAVAESCTGGMLGEWITRIPGSSEFFLGGVIAYSNTLKSQLLEVPPKLLHRYGAVSAPIAEAMAEGMRKRVGSDYGVSITGVAGPSGGSEAKPVGTVFVGYSDGEKKQSVRFHFLGDREVIRIQSTRAALNMLRKEVLQSKRQARGRKSKA
ncbi:MAG: competence/damage-inducible protein A [Acidobacteria bacterium]|nr:competence/damage-inducible protein A [Acidobacteriota bacterium]